MHHKKNDDASCRRRLSALQLIPVLVDFTIRQAFACPATHEDCTTWYVRLCILDAYVVTRKVSSSLPSNELVSPHSHIGGLPWRQMTWYNTCSHMSCELRSEAFGMLRLETFLLHRHFGLLLKYRFLATVTNAVFCVPGRDLISARKYPISPCFSANLTSSVWSNMI